MCVVLLYFLEQGTLLKYFVLSFKKARKDNKANITFISIFLYFNSYCNCLNPLNPITWDFVEVNGTGRGEFNREWVVNTRHRLDSFIGFLFWKFWAGKRLRK